MQSSLTEIVSVEIWTDIKHCQMIRFSPLVRCNSIPCKLYNWSPAVAWHLEKCLRASAQFMAYV